MAWRVERFSVASFRGVCVLESGQRRSFHGRDFVRISPGGPPPICGEEVLIQEETPRLSVVQRVHKPVGGEGVVSSFDSLKGWGFIDSAEEKLFVHKDDIEGGRIPIIGAEVRFYRGYRRGRARACWVQITGGRYV